MFSSTKLEVINARLSLFPLLLKLPPRTAGSKHNQQTTPPLYIPAFTEPTIIQALSRPRDMGLLTPGSSSSTREDCGCYLSEVAQPTHSAKGYGV